MVLIQLLRLTIGQWLTTDVVLVMDSLVVAGQEGV